MSRYDTLNDKLQSFTDPTVTLSFEELDEIVDGLPDSARKYGAWWANTRTSHAHAKAWLDAGRRAQPNFGAGHVVFTANSRDEPRYWIFQPIRSDYQLPSEIATKEVGEEDEWPVIRNGEDMRPGDQVMFYQMRSDQGVYACGELISEPYAERRLNGAYAGTQKPGERVVRVRYTRILPRPFTRADMTRDPGLSNMQMMRSSDCINCRVTPEEWDALQELADRTSNPRFWWVNQGPTYEESRDEGSISAPQRDAAGRALAYWTSLSSVRPGDLIINYARKAVRGISVAEQEGMETTLSNSDGEQVPGWHVRVKIHRFAEPLALEEIPEEWRREPMEGGPFDYRGQVNMGYLYPLPESFAHRFFSRFGERTPEIAFPFSDPPATGDADHRHLVVAQGKTGKAIPDEAPTFERILAALERQGLHFAPESVSNYLLALQAKRFVILTGISGTGKTQLAMAVARAFQPMIQVARPRSIPDDAFARKVVPSMFSAGSMALPVAFTAHLHLPPINPTTNGGQLRVEYPRGASEQTFWKDPNANRIDLSFSGEFRQWINQTFAPGDQMLMTILRQEGDAPDAIRIDVPQKEKRTERLENYRVVAVRPDWTDNRGLLGYYNPITESYVTTEFLRLLLAARAEEEDARVEGRDPHPFFLILDEMNLARVEHYFSDFLSALESGEAIDLHDDPAVEAGEGEEGIAIPRRLEIPGNVYFTGTVNVDETTYMFSPKVLDRAFTIEFNEVDLAGFGAAPLAETDRQDGLRLDRLGSNLEQLGRPRTADWNALAKLGHEDEFRRAIVELNRVLVDHGRHFGYRVANEIARLVTLAARQAGDEEHTLWTVLDLAILQKVLPKFHGTQQELESALAEVFAFTVEGASGGSIGAHFEDWALEGGRLVPTASGNAAEQPRLPRTATKVWRMLDRVRRQGFAAYVE